MPRQKLLDRPIEKCISLPGTLVRQVEILNIDAFTGKVRYGALSKLITQLLREWVAKQQAAQELKS